MRQLVLLCVHGVLAVTLGCGGKSSPSPDSSMPLDGAPGLDSQVTPHDAGPDPQGDAGGDAQVGPDGGSLPVGGEAHRGEILFHESFEDGDYASRGWYDQGTEAVLSADAHAPVSGSARSFRCHFAQGATSCPGSPARRLFTPVESVYLSYWVMYAEGWVGSQRAYHPHEFHFVTDEDGQWVGPARSHLTTYIEQVGLIPRLALQDSRNVDLSCILRNDDSFVGCDGSFDTYVFGENRSVAACNGLLGDLDGRDCFHVSGDYWYSARTWRGQSVAFQTGQWHFVEAYFRMNTMAGGIGQVDGALRLWVDGVQHVASDEILLRTGQYPTMRFNQFFVGPYIGDGSPTAQTVYYDELTVARGIP